MKPHPAGQIFCDKFYLPMYLYEKIYPKFYVTNSFAEKLARQFLCDKYTVGQKLSCMSPRFRVISGAHGN